MSKTECVLKISNHAEPFYTTFDTKTGFMREQYEWIESVYNVMNVKEFDCSPHLLKSKDILYEVALTIVNARLVMTYYDDELLVITDSSWYFCNESGQMIGTPHYIHKPLIKVPVTDVGRALTLCYSFDIFHPASKLATFIWNGLTYVMTRHGAKLVSDDILQADETVRITPAMILDSGVDAYGAYSVNGEIHYIKKEG